MKKVSSTIAIDLGHDVLSKVNLCKASSLTDHEYQRLSQEYTNALRAVFVAISPMLDNIERIGNDPREYILHALETKSFKPREVV